MRNNILRLPAIIAVTGLPLALSAGAAPVRDKVAKHWDARAAADAAETIPDDIPANWGKWHFWNGQWWAKAMFQPESQGPSWEPPRNGLVPAWNALKAVWLRARRPIPSDWSGSRVVLEQNGIRGCRITVFVNRVKAGEISAPGGSLEVTQALKYGAENEFHLLLTGPDPYFRLERDPPMLVVRPPVSIDDVFANTSWREKRLTVETTITVPEPCSAAVSAAVYDRDGKKVRELSGCFELGAGTTTVKPSGEWPDPITWVLGRGLASRSSAGATAWCARGLRGTDGG